MSAIVENSAFKALEQILEDKLDLKSKEMRLLKEAIMKSDIGTMFFTMPGSAAAKVVKEEAKAQKKRGSRKTADGEPKPKRAPNAYMLFLADKREEIKQFLLGDQPELKGKELQNAITKKAGEIWKSATEEDMKPYLDQQKATKDAKATGSVEVHDTEPCCDDHEQSHVEEDAEPTEDAEATETQPEPANAGRKYLEEHKIYWDEDTSLYYMDDNEDTEPIGRFANDKLMPFKKNK